MKHRRVPILALFAAATAFTCAFAEDGIVVVAQETEVDISPGASQLRLVNLPALDFALRAAIRCKGSPASVTLSIADTFETLGKGELEGARVAEVSLTVPARQIALAATQKFCVAGDSGTSDELLVPGLATANGSLRCESESGTTVHYASTALRIRLKCRRIPEGGNPSQSSLPDK